jgi:hypothetical protein
MRRTSALYSGLQSSGKCSHRGCATHTPKRVTRRALSNHKLSRAEPRHARLQSQARKQAKQWQRGAGAHGGACCAAARRATHSLYQWPHTTPATTCHFICNHGSSVNLGTDEEAAVGDALATLLLSAPLWECEAANCHVGGNRPKRQHAGSGQRHHFCPACREPRINCMLALVALLYAKRLERACR